MRIPKTILAGTLSLSLAAGLAPLSGIAGAHESPAGISLIARSAVASTEPIPAAQSKASRLCQNLATRYIVDAKALTNSDDAAVLALGPYLDYQLLLDSLSTYTASEGASAGTLAKYLAMLASTNLREAEPELLSSYVKMLDKLVEEQKASLGAFDLVWVIPALESWSGSGELLDWAVGRLGDFQNEDGLIGGCSIGGKASLSPEYQATAQAVMALSGLEDNSAVSSATKKRAQKIEEAALQVLLGSQQADGGWLYKPNGTKSDVDTTGWVLGALLMFGSCTDNAFSVRLAEEFLVSKADASLDGFSSCSSEALASAAATLGLYSIFTFSSDKLVLDKQNAVATTVAYDGSYQAPSVAIPWQQLVCGRDYTVSKERKKVGTYKNTVVTGTGGVTGSFSCSFTIKPAQVSKLKVSKSGRTLKPSWSTAANKGSGIAGYAVTVKSGSKIVASAKASGKGEATSSAKLTVPASCKGKKLKVSVSGYKGSLKGKAGTVAITL